MTRELISVLAGLAALAAWASAALAQIDVDALARRLKVRYTKVPRKVLVFYYPWYGNAAVKGGSGTDKHWGRVDADKKDIQASTHYPALGAYDSHDPALIARHCRWCKEAGVDGLIVSWWGRRDFTDRAMKPILDACAEAGLEATIYHESVPPPTNASAAAKDILWVVNRYAGHKAWLRAEGRPVVFVYGRAVNQIGLAGWLEAADRINTEHKGGVALIGDRFSRQSARVFDGVHTYNTAGRLRGKTPAQAARWAERQYDGWVGLAENARRISTLTVIPGYDDTKIRKPGLAVRRYDGALYEAQWKQALAADPHWVLITSFNEWHEGSEIEPSHEDGRKYLDLTAKYAKRFKAMGARAAPKAAKAGALSRAKKARLAERLGRLKIALLPDAESAVAWWLVEIGVRPTMLTWEQVAAGPLTAEQFDLLIYAGGEQYRQTVNSPGDVDAAITAYLASGGWLAAFASLPMPFHYNEKHEAVAHTVKFGLPLSVGGKHGGWEEPPAGVTLRFRAGEPLGSLPRTFAFPSTGDPRWRPYVPDLLGESGRCRGLLPLRDESGRDYGYAVGFTQLTAGAAKGGRTAYVWFGLLQHAQLAEGVMHDVLSLIAERLGK